MKKTFYILIFILTSIFQFAYANEPNYILADGTEPQHPLIPAQTTETGGGRIVEYLFSGLTYHDEKGDSHYDLAASIESSDKQHYTVKLRGDAKFSDGTAIQAKHFVDAWNAVVKNKMETYSFFADIAGFPTDGKTVDQLSGLKIIDDKTFTIELKKPIADFEGRLAFTAFSPMADQAFTDIKIYGQNPITSGPYKLANEKAWKHNIEIALIPNEHYNGPRKAQNEGIKFKFYAKSTAAYADLLADNLDLIYDLPDEALLTAQSDLEERYISKPIASVQGIEINVNKEHFKLDKEGLLRRQALSMAINRPEITTIIFNKTKTPARDFTAPVIPGYNPNLKGVEVLNYNPKKAKELWDEADKLAKFTGTFTIAYNADGGHQNWVDAAVNNIKNTLKVAANGDPYPDFKSLLDNMAKQQIKYAYRNGWQADYPSADNFLVPLYTIAAMQGSNYASYQNPKFDKLLADATAAKTADENFALITQAQEILLHDLPFIPLWYKNCNVGYSRKISNVNIDWKGMPMYYKIVKNK